MPISASRIFHVNSNCRQLDRSVSFYRDLLGFSATTHPMPDRPQPGSAFGLDEVLWDGWMLQGDLGYGGLSLDLLEWKVPVPAGLAPQHPAEPGFHHLTFTVPDLADTLHAMRRAGVTIIGEAGDTAMVLDPDDVPVRLTAGTDRRIASVTMNCRDLDQSMAYYGDVMGLQVGAVATVEIPATLLGWDHPATVRRAVATDPGSAFAVELVHFVDVAMPVPRQRQAHHVGLFRMAFSTNDCAGDEAVVRAAGSVPFAPTAALSVGDHLPLLLVLFWPGPDGECLELIQVA